MPSLDLEHGHENRLDVSYLLFTSTHALFSSPPLSLLFLNHLYFAMANSFVNKKPKQMLARSVILLSFNRYSNALRNVLGSIGGEGANVYVCMDGLITPLWVKTTS